MLRAVHYLSSNESRSWRFDGGALVAGDPAPGAALVVVADFADESYVLAKLPQIRGRDGSLLRRRRLEREFPGVALAAVQPLRRSRDGDGLDTVMIAVPGSTAVQETLAALATTHAIRAVTTPALLAGAWMQRARIRGRRVLVVMPTPAGVRLMFLDDGRPTLSRLTGPLAPQATSAELARTVQYLQNTQRVARGEAVELWFWGVDDATAAACMPTGVEVVRAASPQVGSLPDPARAGFDALLAFAAQQPGRPQLAPDETRIGWLAHEFERACRLGAIAAGVLALLGGALLEWRIQRAGAETDDVVARRAAIEQETAVLASELESRGVTLAEVTTLPEAERLLAGGGVDAGAALAVAGVGFGAQPDVLVQAVELRAAPLAGTPEATAVAAPAEAEAGGADPAVEAAACSVGLESSMLVEFGLAPGLDVRGRDAALGWVREASTQLRPWHAAPQALALGRHDPLVVTAERDEAHADSRWAVCLRREAAS
ncbi:MAG: hypothetical protein U1F18_13525 [Steroidobacteraceae bacterium]